MANDQRGPQQRPPLQPAAQRPPARQPDAVSSGLPAVMANLPPVRGMHRDVATLHEELHKLRDKVHLLSPTIDPSYVPEFHEVSVRLVAVDDRLEAAGGTGDVYRAQGWKDDERALTRHALDRIAAAAGLSWDPVRSGRVDDGSDPNYVHYRAVGYVRDLDGSRRTVVGEREIDLRDGNPAIFTEDRERMAREWDQRNNRWGDQVKNPGFVKGWSALRLAEARNFILAMAETKAKNRVVRSLGVKQKYRAAELRKPFAVLALVLTGSSTDPELERLAKTRMLDAALQTSRELYGESTPTPRPLPEPLKTELSPVLERHAPPPLRAVDPDEDERDDGVRVAEIVCGCPDGPAGTHEEGCEYGN